MPPPQVQSGQIVDVTALAIGFESDRVAVLLKTDAVEVLRVFIPAGEAVPTYEAQGEVILHCLEGAVRLSAVGAPQALKAGKLVYLVVQEPFSLLGVEDSVLLMTVLTTRRGPQAEVIGEM
jgi:quercetin dioxygenase-like cupin family protein